MSVREKVYGMPELMLMPAMMACPGCQHPVAGRIAAEVLKELGIDGNSIAIMGVGCAGGSLFMANIDVTLPAHGRAPDAATAIKRVRPDTIVWTMQGDGDCIAIGAGPFVGALTRGEKITILMCNNTNYGTTGGQLAPTTVMGQVTSTSPQGRNAASEGYTAHTAELAATFKGCAYSARSALTSPDSFQRTKRYIKKAFQKQIDNVGLGFVEVITACPVNWRKTPVECVQWIEDEVLAEFPLGEFKDVDSIE
ncbi:MAG: thiamine pyrophosphate-dependent enzyme [Thermodesulfobacteriota bacterium]|nr:thiamine pyrophosphate-dependent enzyme [Thermodesulfobacteriota bacterium]